MNLKSWIVSVCCFCFFYFIKIKIHHPSDILCNKLKFFLFRLVLLFWQYNELCSKIPVISSFSLCVFVLLYLCVRIASLIPHFFRSFLSVVSLLFCFYFRLLFTLFSFPYFPPTYIPRLPPESIKILFPVHYFHPFFFLLFSFSLYLKSKSYVAKIIMFFITKKPEIFKSTNLNAIRIARRNWTGSCYQTVRSKMRLVVLAVYYHLVMIC